MNKKVIYSCITGGYDNIPVHKYVAPDWDYILFTDNDALIKKGKFKHWIIKPLNFDKLDNVKNARWHKINTHKLFPQYDYSLWLDSNIIVNKKHFFEYINELIKKNVLVAVPNHPGYKCIYKEAKIIKQNKIDYHKIVNAEMKILHDKKYPYNNGLSETCILFRKHNKIKNMLNLWWKMVYTYSKRDQLSFNYALWEKKIHYTPIYTDQDGFGVHRKSKDFSFIYIKSHNQNRICTDKNNVNKKHDIKSTIIRIIALFIPIACYRRRFKNKLLRG